jgi:serine/threonine-protein kinase
MGCQVWRRLLSSIVVWIEEIGKSSMLDDSLVGSILEGKYELVKVLGTGGMGSVYLGQHVVLGKRVAVKFLHANYARDASMVRRFFREAQAAAAIGHKNIIDVLDVAVTAEGTPYLVMEYLEGESLATMLVRRGRLDFAAACGIMEPILLALQAAHDKGIVHRDLKPDNVFLAQSEDEITVKLIDFGISKHTGSTGNTNLTQAGALMGTPAYMSPEQVAGVSDVDARSDVWSAGCILHELLAGVPPFDGENINRILAAVLTEQVVAPTTRFPGFPPEAEGVVLKALVRERAGRFASAREMLEFLRATHGFARRRESLTLAAVGMEKDVASGDLGKPGVSQSESASDVYREMVVRGTPTTGNGGSVDRGGPHGTQQAWSDVGTGPIARKPKRWSWLVAGGFLGLTAFAVVVGFALSATSEPTTGLVAQPSPVSSATTTPIEAAVPVAESPTVRIVLRGVPEGAAIFFGNVLQTSSAFSFPRSSESVELVVRREGYATFREEIAPSEDVTLDIELKPQREVRFPSPARELKVSTPANDGTEPPGAVAPAPQADPDEGRLKKGRRGTKYMEDFGD